MQFFDKKEALFLRTIRNRETLQRKTKLIVTVVQEASKLIAHVRHDITEISFESNGKEWTKLGVWRIPADEYFWSPNPT